MELIAKGYKVKKMSEEEKRSLIKSFSQSSVILSEKILKWASYRYKDEKNIYKLVGLQSLEKEAPYNFNSLEEAFLFALYYIGDLKVENNKLKKELDLFKNEPSQWEVKVGDYEKQIVDLQVKLSNTEAELESLKQRFITETVEKDNLIRLKDKQLQETQIKVEELEKEFKEFIISLIGGKKEGLINESFQFVKKLYLILSQDKRTTRLHLSNSPIRKIEEESINETQEVDIDSIPEEFDFENPDYLDSLECFCGRQKTQTAKGCDLHRSKSKSVAAGRSLGMEEAWNIIYENWRRRL